MHATRSSATRAPRAPNLPGEGRRTLPPRAAALVGGTGAAFALLAWLAAADAVTAPHLADPAPTAASRADCLWYAARNHGFFPVQRDVVRAFVEGRAAHAGAAPTTSAADLRSWEGFVGTVGAQECGASSSAPSSVLAALAATADDADRYFLGATR